VISRSEDFRKHADECDRLSAHLKSQEHKAFARALVSAWLALAEEAKRRETVTDGAISTQTGPNG
jgi:hypothetical protein